MTQDENIGQQPKTQESNDVGTTGTEQIQPPPPMQPPPQPSVKVKPLRGPNDEEPNVKLSGRHNPVTVDGEVNVGQYHTFYLPSEEVQRAGFFVPDLNVFVNQFRPMYLPIKDKAAKQRRRQGQPVGGQQ